LACDSFSFKPGCETPSEDNSGDNGEYKITKVCLEPLREQQEEASIISPVLKEMRHRKDQLVRKETKRLEKESRVDFQLKLDKLELPKKIQRRVSNTSLSSGVRYEINLTPLKEENYLKRVSDKARIVSQSSELGTHFEPKFVKSVSMSTKSIARYEPILNTHNSQSSLPLILK